MAESGDSSGSADSYIGSVISLISKSDIRYEGVLGGINTEDSTIQLNRVKSYGTEGRNKAGPQILPSDREFAYILFRGSDIKDLQVKSSPPIHTQEPLYNDPAIIQSHYAHVPSSSATSDPVSARSVTGVNINGESSNFPGPVYQGATYSSYPGEGLGTYGCATQNVEGSSLAMPMYLNGSYGPHNSLPSGQQRPIPFQPPTGPGPSTFQSSEVQVSGSSNMGRLSEHRNVPHPVNRTDYLLPYDMPSGVTPTVVSTSYPSDMPLPVMTSLSSNPTSMTSNLPTMTSVAPLNQNVNANVAPFSDNKFGVAMASGLPIQPFASSILGSTSGPSLEISAPLLTPNQLVQPGLLSAPSSTQTLYHEEKNMEVLGPLLSNPSYAVSSAPIQMPLLPLPYSQKQLNESVMGSRPTNGDRREDRRQTFQNSTMQFTEEFDFIAMNEKFKKDEVWGYLGKAKQNNKTEGIVGNQNDQSEGHDGGYGKGSETNEKPVYVKDEFFDTLSSSSFGRGARNGGRRTDNEDLGNFQQRPYMSRGGRGFGRGGYYRGSNNHGSGYGYGMRGYMP